MFIYSTDSSVPLGKWYRTYSLDDVIKWKHFPRYWPFVRGIHRWIPHTKASESFDVFFDMRPNNRLSKQPWGWWFETPSRSLWRHCNMEDTRRNIMNLFCAVSAFVLSDHVNIVPDVKPRYSFSKCSLGRDSVYRLRGISNSNSKMFIWQSTWNNVKSIQ